jgi:hypothetical protein
MQTGSSDNVEDREWEDRKYGHREEKKTVVAQ